MLPGTVGILRLHRGCVSASSTETDAKEQGNSWGVSSAILSVVGNTL